MTDLNSVDQAGASKPVTEAKPKRREKLAENLSILRSVTISTIAILAVAAVVIVTLRDLTRAPVVLEEIGVTRALERNGYTGLVLSNMLWDEIDAIGNVTGTGNKTVRVQTEDSQLDVVEPGSGLSLKRVTQVLRSLFNLPQTRISGEFVCPQTRCKVDELSLTLRVSTDEGTTVITSGAIGDQTMQEYIQALALQVLEEEIDPLVAAWYYYYQEPDYWEASAREIATREMLKGGPRAEEAMTLLGYIDLYLGYPDQALSRSDEAIRRGDEVRASRTFPQRVRAYFKGDGFNIIRADSLHLQAMTSEDMTKAGQAFEDAMKYAPQLAYIPSEYGYRLYEAEDYNKANIYFEKAAKLEPSNTYNLGLWAANLDALGDEAAAQEKREIIVALTWDDPWLEYHAGTTSIDEALEQAEAWAMNKPFETTPWLFWYDMLWEKHAIDVDGFCTETEGPLDAFLSAAYYSDQTDILVKAMSFEEACGGPSP